MAKAISDNRKAYLKNYQSNCRGIVCGAIRGTLEDAEFLNRWKDHHPGTTWLQLLYRGAGIKRPNKVKTTNTSTNQESK